MALVKFGGGVVQMSGSIGGNTFARNSYGNYVRARTTPVNPNSTRQQAVKAAISFLAAFWAQSLTFGQRAAWNLYASNVAMTNRLGESTFLTGYNHFIRSNSLLKRGTDPIMPDGPPTFELPATDPTLSFVADQAGQQLTISYDDTMTWADENSARMHIFQGQPQNAQRNFFDGPWRYLGKLSGSASSGLGSPQVLPVDFAITAGQREWIYARIQRGDGRLSSPFRADSFVVA